ncbi:OprO/OprP family phosphate-selective porin [Luteithermobacter gelatinilyticus]|uniref:OprO/OprP family phosphate-selective porin n=1 Tax=Luteithermobacter gelatinilyticus TaxID=2582913 RepID=UPI00143DE73B|nr:porin [Luteithermobacter gelatinilyticus]
MSIRKRLTPILAATALSGVAFAAPASAQSVEELQRQINALQNQINDLKKNEKKDDSGSDLNVKWKGAPELSSKDGKFKMKVRGRLYVDYGNVSADDAAGNSLDADKVDGTEFRTARLGVEGVVFKDVKYKFEADFAGDEVEVKDAYLEWKLKPVSVMVGQFKTPNSLEEQTSSRYITFMERGSFTDAFSLSRQTGIALNYVDNGMTFKAGLFQGDAASGGDKQDRTYAARATYGAKFDGALVHVGASVRYRELDEAGTVRYRQRPHNHQASRYVNTGNFAVDNDTFFGLELAGRMGPFSAQAEWAWQSADLVAMDDNASFNGGYVDLSYFLTGEERGYKKGAFSRVKVKNPVFEGGMGAWQIAARYDVVDLTDNEALIDGGKQETWILGVNWHLNNYTRVMANYSHSDIEGGADDGTDVDTFGLRFQVDW